MVRLFQNFYYLHHYLHRHMDYREIQEKHKGYNQQPKDWATIVDLQPGKYNDQNPMYKQLILLHQRMKHHRCIQALQLQHTNQLMIQMLPCHIALFHHS